MEFRSQHGQDEWIIREVFPDMRGGYFVEFGATEGTRFSNTYVLEKEFGWNGILVEPLDFAFEKLVKNRNCICENTLLWKNNDPQHFSVARWKMLSGITEVRSNLRQEGSEAVDTKIIQPVTLEQLLDKHSAPKEIEYVSVDTEGSEYDILSVFDFNKYYIKAFTIEHNGPEAMQKIDTLMQNVGYELIKKVKCDIWYLHRNFLNKSMRP